MASDASGERGASLMLVVIFVTIFSVIAAALLEFANTGFETTKAVKEVRNDQNGVDGAMEGAINSIRKSSTAGFVGFCPDFHYDGSTEGSGEDPDVTVTCTPVASSTTGGVDDRFPKYAVMLLGTAADEGFEQTQFEEVTIDGGVFSNSRIDVVQTNARLRVWGDAFATGPCTTSKMIVSGATDCTADPLVDTDPDWPDYPSAGDPDTMTEVEPEEVTCTAGGVAIFPPGRYMEHPGLYATRAACSTDVWWFQPGVFYFGYTDDVELNDRDGDPNGSVASIIGGTRLGWTDSTNGSSITLPGACDPGTLDAPQPGVQLILGGAANLIAKNGSAKLNMCGGEFLSSGTRQRIVVYGLGSGFSRTAQGTAASPLTRRASGQTTIGFTDLDRATNIDSQIETALLGKNQEASITLNNFFPDIPEGATIDAAWLRITNSATGQVNWDLTISDGDTETDDIVFDNGDVSGGRIDLLDAMGDGFRWRQVRDLVAKYRAYRGNGGSAVAQTTTLDGIELQIAYTEPGAQSPVCVQDPACPMLLTETNSIAYFEGTVYVPNSWVDARIHNSGRTAFKRGLIAWALKGTMNASSTQSDAPFQLGGERGLRKAVLEATIDGASEPSLRALVSFDDTGALPGRGVTIHDWAVLRP
jgi:hypothetical protein